jgi:CheY-like chemotaxis protein
MILQHLARRKVAIIGFERAEADSISGSFMIAEALARIVVPGTSPPGMNPYAYYDICVLNCIANGDGDSRIDQLNRSHEPLLLVGEAEAAAQALPTFLSVRKDFVTRPYRAEELLLRADRLVGNMDVSMGAVARTSGQRSVLIAEDEEVTGALIATILKVAGFECALARNGQLALEMAKQKKPDVLLLDVNMPALSGFDTLVALRAHPATQDLPVIMVTGNRAEGDIVRGFELGANDYIVKPFNARELVARVDRAVRQAESRLLS